jgi:predicted RND superfamily exporter protein
MNAMNSMIGFAVRRRAWLMLAIAVLTGGFGYLASRLEVDNSLEVWFVEDDPALRSYESFLEEFGNDETVVIAIAGPGDALAPDRLERTRRLTDRIEAIDGIARVQSLSNLLLPGVADPAEALAEQRLASRLVGRHQKSLLLVAWMETSADMDVRRPEILDAVRAATRDHLADDERAHFGGVGVLYDALNRATIGEGALFIGLSYAVITIALLFVTRRIAWTLIALLVVTLADVTLLGAMTLLGRPINMITMALPPVVMILGVANVVHMATDLDLALARGTRSLVGLRKVLARITVPCAFNALTTGVAFLSLTTANMAVTRDYGLFAAIGVGVAFIYSVALMAAFLPHACRLRPPARSTSRLARVAEWAMVGSLRRPVPVVLLTAILVAVAVWGASRIVVDTNSFGFLPGDDVVLEDDRALAGIIGPYLPMELTIRAERSSWRSREFLERVAAAQAVLEKDPRVGASTTANDLLREALLATANETLPRPWVPATDEEILVAEARLRAAGFGAALDQFVAADGRTLRLTASTGSMSVRNFTAVARDARKSVQDVLGAEGVVNNSGYMPLYGQMIEHVVSDQVTSFGLAFLLVFAVVSLALRSWRFALVAIPPNLLPVAILLGVMGFAGINLDIATVTVAAVVLGVIVDDTVHVLHRLRRELQGGAALESAVRDVAGATGLAVVSTSLVFASGFFVISLAASSAIAHSGLLMAIAVVAALVTDLVLLPAFVAFAFGRRGLAEQKVSEQ